MLDISSKVFNEQFFVGASKRTEYNKNILDFINTKRDKDIKILDIGCGDGTVLDVVSNVNDNISYLGLDISKPNIDFAKDKYKNNLKCNFVLENYFEFRPSNKFDLIISYSTLHLLNNPKKALEKIYSELNAGGTVIIGMPYACFTATMYIFLRYALLYASKIGLKNIVMKIIGFFLKRNYGKERIEQAVSYMTIFPSLLYDAKIRNFLINLGFSIETEAKEIKYEPGKPPHINVKLVKR